MQGHASTISGIFALAALLLASCADSNGSAAGPARPMTQAQYEQQVEEGFGDIGPLLINWTEPAAPSGRRVAGHW